MSSAILNCPSFFTLPSFLLHVWLFCWNTCLCTTRLRRTEENIGSLRTGAKDGRELSRGLWGLNLGPLQEQPGLLTVEPLL